MSDEMPLTSRRMRRGMLGIGWFQFGSVLALILIAAALLLFYQSRNDFQKSVVDAKEDIAAVSESRMVQLEAWWSERQSDIRYIFDGQWHSVKPKKLFSGNHAEVDSVVPTLDWLAPKFGNSNYEMVVVIDLAGHSIASRPLGERLTKAESESILPKLANAKASWSTTTFDMDGLPLHEDFVVPFFSTEGKDTTVIGAAVLRIPLQTRVLSQLEGALSSLESFVQYLILSEDGTRVLADRRVSSERSLKLDSLIMTLRSGTGSTPSITTAIDQSGREHIVAMKRGKILPWTLVVTHDLDSIARVHQLEIRSTAIIFLLLFLLSGVGLFFITYREQQRAQRQKLEHEIEQQRLQGELRDADADFRLLFDRSLDAILIATPEGKILKANAAACKMFGYTVEQFQAIGRDALIEFGDDRGRVAIERRKSEGSFHGMLTYRRADGSSFPADASTTIVNTRNTQQVHAIIRDISDIIAAQQELKRRELHLIESQRTGRIGSWEADFASAKVYWSDNLFALVGRNPEQGPLSIEDTLHLFTSVKRTDLKLDTHSSQGGRKSIEGQKEYVAPDGARTIFHYTLIEVSEEGGKSSRLLGTVVDITDLAQAEQEIRSLVAHLVSAREDERTSIARNIHDDLGQMLTAVKIDMMNLSKQLVNTPQAARVRTTLDLVDGMIKTVKRLTSELRPGILDDLGLSAAIEWHLHQFTERTGVQHQLDFIFPEQYLSKEVSTTLFRVTQEALTNVARHANAKNVSVEVFEDMGSVVLKVKDDGGGLSQEEINHPHSFGLLSIRERAAYFGGRAEFISDKGTTVLVTLPILEGETI